MSVLFDSGCQWSHSDFQIDTSISVDICGPLVYTIDAGDLNVFITYDIDMHIIILYSEDMNLVTTGTFTYTISVSLEMFPTCGGCNGHSTGTITIISPCVGPQLTVGVVLNIDFSFNGPTTWTPPPVTIAPSVCYPQVVYQCTYEPKYLRIYMDSL